MTKEGKLSKFEQDLFYSQYVGSCLANGVDFFKRRIYLLDEITSETAAKFIIGFQTLDQSQGIINVILCSPGGSETEGHAIYDVIRSANNYVIIDSYGAVQSIAALILQAAGLRRMAPLCTAMIHNGTMEMGDESIATDDLVELSSRVKKSNGLYHKILADRSGLALTKVRRLCEDETFFSAEEALKLGLIDEIIPINDFGNFKEKK